MHCVSNSFVSIHVIMFLMICCESTIINNGYCFTWPGVNKILGADFFVQNKNYGNNTMVALVTHAQVTECDIIVL